MDFKYPYTDFHELNLDWFLARFKELVEEWNQVESDWNSLHDYVQNYFDNLNVQNEINNKLDALVADGTLATIMEPYIDLALPSVVDGKLPAVVANQIGAVVAAQIGAVVANQLPAAVAGEAATWLAAHVDPDTGYVIDDTLTITDAAADAKVTGDMIKLINDSIDVFGKNRNGQIVDIIAMIGSHTDATSSGVTFTWSADGTYCTVTGTSHANSDGLNNIWGAPSTYPPALLNHKPLFYVKSSNVEHLYGQVYWYIGGSIQPERVDLKDGFTEVTIPNNASGFAIRLVADKGSITYNDTITIKLILGDCTYLPSWGISSLDMVDMIEKTLAAFGECHLGPGLYVVASGITMPEGSKLIGSGENTIVRFTGTSGSAIEMASKCMVKDLTLEGSKADITISGSIPVANEKHGILWKGTYTSSLIDKDSQPVYGMIDNVVIRRFTGGAIRGMQTSPQVNHGLQVTNVSIYNCNAGIYLSNECEFNRFTNVMCYHCYYACINNSGNNTFINCGFSDNIVGMILKKFYNDDSQETTNNTHGSAIGCVFDHIDRDDTTLGKGEAVHFESGSNGFIFDGCHFFYSKIYLKDSTGIMFTNCLFGPHKADDGTTDDYPIEIVTTNASNRGTFFNSCNFSISSPPDITLTEASPGHMTVRMDTCYNRKGEIITA